MDGTIRWELREVNQGVVPTLKCKQSFECSGHAPRAVEKNARFIPPLFLVRHMLSVTKAIGTLSELSQRVIALRKHGEMSDPELKPSLERRHAHQ